MTHDEILEGSRLMSQFLGWRFSEEYYELPRGLDINTHAAIPHMKFHKSWDWLVPVWSQYIRIMNDQVKMSVIKGVNEAFRDNKVGIAFSTLVIALTELKNDQTKQL